MIHVGFAETDITPKLGSQSPGGMQARRLQEVHDPLKAVAMVIQNDQSAVALVGIDSTLYHRGNDGPGPRSDHCATKIPGVNVLIGASHTHGGGPVATCFESEADPDYVDLVAKRVAEAVISAYHSLHAAEIGDGIGHEPSISFNRRFLMRDGRQATHPGKGNPEIVKPAGPLTPTSACWRLAAPGGELLGVFVNFACHLTVMGGNGFTADYVYHLRETLSRHYKKPSSPVGFLLGAAGDVTQVDNLRPGREFGEEWSSMFGLALGAEVIQTVARMTWQQEAVLQSRSDFRPYPHPRAATSGPRYARAGAGLWIDRGGQDLCPRARASRSRTARRPLIPCEVQAIRIGDLGLVTNGAEFFCQLGLDIKAASPLPGRGS